MPVGVRHRGATRARVLGKPPATGAWREGDPAATAGSSRIGDARRSSAAATLPAVRIAYETWGDAQRRRATTRCSSLHALTGDSHVVGAAGPGHPTAGWWGGIVGPGLAHRHRPLVRRRPEHARRLPGLDRPRVARPRRRRVGRRASRSSPSATRSRRRSRSPTALGIERWARRRRRLDGRHAGARVGASATPTASSGSPCSPRPPSTSADQIALNSVQLEAIRMDPAFAGGDYYDAADGEGPHRGLALARRMALLNYRSPDRAQRPVRPQLAERRQPARRRRPVRGRELPRLPRQQVHPPLRRQQLHHARRGDELARRRPRPRRRRRGARPGHRARPSCSASTATGCSRSPASASSPRHLPEQHRRRRAGRSSPPTSATTPSSSRSRR